MLSQAFQVYGKLRQGGPHSCMVEDASLSLVPKLLPNVRVLKAFGFHVA